MTNMNFTLERELMGFLEEAEGKIREKLSSYPISKPSREIIPDVLELLGALFFEASKIYYEWKDKPPFKDLKQLEFSFFPGYINRNQERLTPKIRFSAQDIYTDIRFSQPEKYAKYKPSLLAVANKYCLHDPEEFDHPYTGKKVTNIFIGGTHEWASSVVDGILLKDSKFNLELITFFKSKPEARSSQENDNTWLSLPFAPDDKNIKEWCEKMVAEMGVYHHIKWPFDFFYPNVTNAEPKGRLILEIRAYLVGLWLKILFSPKEMTTNFNNPWWNFLEIVDVSSLFTGDRDTDLYGIPQWSAEKQFEAVKERVRRLKMIIENQVKDIYINHPFSFCYTIPFKKAPRFVVDEKKYGNHIHILDPERVGSVMVFTNFVLGKTFFRIITPWLESVYDLLKDFENTKELYEGRDHEWKIILRQLRHNLLTHLRIQSNLEDLEKIHYITRDMEQIIRLTKYLESEEELKKYVQDILREEFNLTHEVTELAKTIISSIVKIPEGWPIQKSRIESLTANYQTILEFVFPDEDLIIQTIPWLARIILKDIITNALKNVDKAEPKVRIGLSYNDQRKVVIYVENNEEIPSDWQIVYSSENNFLPESPDQIGIYIIKRYSKELQWKIDCNVIPFNEIKSGTRISITIPIT